MNNQNINIFIECGEKGTGKTTYAMQKWSNNLIIKCGDPLNQIKTMGSLFFALVQYYNTVTDNHWDIVKHLHKAIEDGYVLIIDEAECIDQSLLETIINTALSSKRSTIAFIFDINCKYLYQSKIFRQLIEWDLIMPNNQITNFCAEKEVFDTIINNYIPEASNEFKKELIKISNYNFNNIKRLLWLILNKQSDFVKIDENVMAEYSYYLIEEKMANLPEDLIDILKKSSLIGKMFQSYILESSDGFNVLGVKTYLKKLEATNMFIQSYVYEDIYQFISNSIHMDIIKTIQPNEKLESQQILLNYYIKKLISEQNNDKILEYLQQIKRLSYELNNHDIMIFADKKLLFCYLKIGDIIKAKELLTDLLFLCRNHLNDNMLYQYLSYYKIKLDMNISCFHDALDEISVVKRDIPNGSNVYLQYYHAKSLYGIGNIDLSIQKARELVSVLKSTSSKVIENQPIYPLAYSLLATIQHHFGIEDYGNRYYVLALNHAKYKLTDKSIYFEIIKKCDMYYDFKHSKSLLMQSIEYFESVGKKYDLAEVYVNLATEMMFNDVNCLPQANTFFQKALKIFSNTPNENLAYVKNNFALLHIIQFGDFSTAISILETALLVGLSDFTYMTLYINLCMCYLFLYGSNCTEFSQAYILFSKYHSNIKNRENSTQYEDIYKELLDIIVLEHKGEKQKVLTIATELISNINTEFFIPIFEDIKRRNSQDIFLEKKYTTNSILYMAFHKYKVFLAEFRFWE